MARKLTDVERMNLDYLRETLCQVLEPSQKNKAASVASALVRVRGDVVTDEDIKRIVGKYGKEAQVALTAAVCSEALDPVEGQEGVYTLRVPSQVEGADGAGEKAEGDAGTAGAVDENEPAPEVVDTSETVEEPAAADGTTAAEEPAAADGATAAEEPAAATDPTPADASKPGDAQVPEASAQPGDAAQPAPPARVEKPGRSSAPRTQRGRLRRVGKGSPSHPTQLSEVPYVRRGGPAETEVRAKILELDQRFWMNGWLLSHPGAYTLFERQLTAINDALVNGALPGDITRRQLAYQMGGDEKFFEYGSDGHKLLRAMGMEDVIRHRPMPKPDLLYHAPRRRKHMRVLVTETPRSLVLTCTTSCTRRVAQPSWASASMPWCWAGARPSSSTTALRCSLTRWAQTPLRSSTGATSTARASTSWCVCVTFWASTTPLRPSPPPTSS